MGVYAVPDHDHGPGQVPMEKLEEAHDIGRADGAIQQHQEEARPSSLGRVGRRADGREVLPVPEAMDQDRRLAARRPGALDRGPLREAALVEEDDVGATFLGVFFTAGHVS